MPACCLGPPHRDLASLACWEGQSLAGLGFQLWRLRDRLVCMLVGGHVLLRWSREGPQHGQASRAVGRGSHVPGRLPPSGSTPALR